MIDQDSFRLGMRYLAAGVNVITTVDTDGERYGMTATAVCSVCAEPPTLLACINRRNTTLAPLQSKGVFVINVLGMRDRVIADRFSRPMSASEKFGAGEWCVRHTGAPVLSTALVSFECRVSQTVCVGTHDVVFGAIEAVHVSPTAHGPLLYGHGAYGALSSVNVPEKQILEMLRGGANDKRNDRIALAPLLEREPDTRADIEFATATAAVQPTTQDGRDYLDALDAQIVSLLGLARADGTIGDAGLAPQDYKVYVDAAESVADKEFSRLEEAFERLDIETTARHTHSGLEVANLLFGALHTRALLRRVARRFGQTRSEREAD